MCRAWQVLRRCREDTTGGPRRVYSSGGLPEIGVIKKVERPAAKLEFHALVDTEFLEQGEVQAEISGTINFADRLTTAVVRVRLMRRNDNTTERAVWRN